MEIRSNYNIHKQPNFNGSVSNKVKLLVREAARTDLRTIVEDANCNGTKVDESILDGIINKSHEIVNDLDELMRPFHPSTILDILTHNNQKIASFTNTLSGTTVKHNLDDIEPLTTLCAFDKLKEKLQIIAKPKDIDNKFLDVLIERLKELAAKPKTKREILNALEQTDTFSRTIGEQRGTKETLEDELRAIYKDGRAKQREAERRRLNTEMNNNLLDRYLDMTNKLAEKPDFKI